MTYNLHRALVCKESARLAKTFQGAFQETITQACTLSEEDPRIFGYFVEYLYREGWLHDDKSKLPESELSTLAQLYCTGDRLLATSFQDLVLRKIAETLGQARDLSDHELCNLLEIAAAEVPDLPGDDALQAQVCWYAAQRFRRLQKFSRFPELLREHPQLAVKLCMLAGDGSNSQPKLLGVSNHQRFKPESVYS